MRKWRRLGVCCSLQPTRPKCETRHAAAMARVPTSSKCPLHIRVSNSLARSLSRSLALALALALALCLSVSLSFSE
jgi:hypothetical protein